MTGVIMISKHVCFFLLSRQYIDTLYQNPCALKRTAGVSIVQLKNRPTQYLQRWLNKKTYYYCILLLPL